LNNSQRIVLISKILQETLPLFSQWDEAVIKGQAFQHPWIDKLQRLDEKQLADFDAGRDHTLLSDQKWLDLNKEIAQLCKFENIDSQDVNLLTPLGNKKKQHELKQLYKLLQGHKRKSITDFGGGVGNLAHFLEKELAMDVTVFEKDATLIQTGIEKLKKQKSHIQFKKVNISNDSSPNVSTQMAIGLHTCGNFATNMLRTCYKSKVSHIINFGCCYSKIENDDYNLSSLSDKTLHFNRRALSIATLSFDPVPMEIYNYRIQIMDYKYSFYHWLYKKHGILEFRAMSNARRSLYKKSFSEFLKINLEKFFPNIELPSESEVMNFYHSEENKELNHYFKAYYAIARYLGRLVETYILLDRAIYLEEMGYQTVIKEVFDSKISPRNKAIIAH
jgi:hypothetical protein